MQPTQFPVAVQSILLKDHRYVAGAYYFLKDSLDFTLSQIIDKEGGEPRHISGNELTQGFCDFAFQEFGPMASTLMKEWGILSSRDIGVMVFQLIDEGAFGKQDSDKLEDFEIINNLVDYLKLPFLPRKKQNQLSASA